MYLQLVIFQIDYLPCRSHRIFFRTPLLPAGRRTWHFMPSCPCLVPRPLFGWSAVPVVFWACCTALSVSRSSPTKRNGVWGRVSSCSVMLLTIAAYCYKKNVDIQMISFLSFLTTQDGFTESASWKIYRKHFNNAVCYLSIFTSVQLPWSLLVCCYVFFDVHARKHFW